MVLGIFKSKKNKKKDQLKAEIKNVGGGRSNQSKVKRLKRELKSLDAPKKEEKKGPRVGGAQANKRKNYGNNQTGGGGNTTGNTTNKKKVVKKSTMTGAERAKAMAKTNIKKYGGTASAAAANKEAMRKRIKERYQAKKNKKK